MSGSSAVFRVWGVGRGAAVGMGAGVGVGVGVEVGWMMEPEAGVGSEVGWAVAVAAAARLVAVAAAARLVAVLAGWVVTEADACGSGMVLGMVLGMVADWQAMRMGIAMSSNAAGMMVCMGVGSFWRFGGCFRDHCVVVVFSCRRVVRGGGRLGCSRGKRMGWGAVRS